VKRNKKGQFVRGTHWRREKPYWNKQWLEAEYAKKSLSDIAKEWGVGHTAIGYWLQKHGIKGRTMVEAHQLKEFPRLFGKDNPMYGVVGDKHPGWRGGVTPERQALYSSTEWAKASRIVWKRDGGKCRRCEKRYGECSIHIHHVESFANREKRSDPSNLILLCYDCHRFVHSKKNVNKEYIVDYSERKGER
jgi:hypothetical protein